MIRQTLRLMASVLGVSLALGCGAGQPKRLPAPAIDPDKITRAIMDIADSDGDGVLTSGEFTKVPSVGAIVRQLDGNGDGAVSSGEIANWLTRLKESRVAIGSGVFEVIHKGRPLANVQVTLVPESFMGGGMQVAQGVTDAGGIVNPTIPGSPHHGVNYGLYRVELRGQGTDGAPLPANYNTATTLGIGLGEFMDAGFCPSLSFD